MDTVLASVCQTPLFEILGDSDGKRLCNLVTLDPKHDPIVGPESSSFFDNRSILAHSHPLVLAILVIKMSQTVSVRTQD